MLPNKGSNPLSGKLKVDFNNKGKMVFFLGIGTWNITNCDHIGCFFYPEPSSSGENIVTIYKRLHSKLLN